MEWLHYLQTLIVELWSLSLSFLRRLEAKLQKQVKSLPLYGGHNTLTKRIVIAIGLLCCLALCLNLNAQAGGDVADQIKQLQQDSRDAQMKNDSSWAQQHLADGFVAGNSWGDWQT